MVSLVPIVAGVIVLLIIVSAIASAVEIVEATERKALTVFGEYRYILDQGLNLIPPFVSKTYTFDMRTQPINVEKQEAITRDNSPVTCDAVVYLKVNDPEKAFLEVDDYKKAVTNLAQTTLRSTLGDMELDDTLNKRREINARIQQELDESTDAWGIKVESVEVKEVTPSQDVQDAMEEQTAAERRRRAMILEAQGQRRSDVETAMGKKQANVIEAQGEKKAQVLEAQGDALSTVYRAYGAEAMGERAVIERGLDTLEEIGQSESTKWIIPQELTSLLGRYGRNIGDGDVSGMAGDLERLPSQAFDDETEQLLGLDSVEEMLDDDDVDLEEVGDPDDIEDPEEVVGETEEVVGDENVDVGGGNEGE